ncbi:hypothetical protein THTE_2283 [Thermogutta terrifontis]|uniref:Uncharacterized protein n=1 Tax=Thermogutta terrifontis TaxID=1331910 RepID=A0A286RG04_9BACT|nr:hypothetical protein THTE_2283 [Thermogutta terrifontis]
MESLGEGVCETEIRFEYVSVSVRIWRNLLIGCEFQYAHFGGLDARTPRHLSAAD